MRDYFKRQAAVERQPRKMPLWLQQLLDHLADLFAGPPEEAKPLMTYEEAMGFFVTRRPQGIPIQQGIILRERRADGFLVIQGFMDAQNNFVQDHEGNPCMRQVMVQRLDDELLYAFGNDDVIIVQ